MSTCNILGTIRDSGNIPLTGELWVQLDTNLVDEATTPDSVILPRLYKFPITAGVVNINLPESETQQVTYRLQFWAQADAGPPAVLDNDPVLDFHAMVPNQASVELSDLIPTGVTTDSLDTAIARIARILATNSTYSATLRGGPEYLGVYDPGTFYQLDDCVSYAGSSWIWINPEPGAGSTPSTLNTDWQQAAAKGDPGGTGGQDTAYDATGWNGQTWAPTANAIRDVIVTLAPLASPALTGNPTAPTQSVGNNTTRLATTAFVIAEIISRFANAALTGTPTAPTQATGDSTTAIASTAFVKQTGNRYAKITDTKAQNTAGGASTSGTQTRVLNTIDHNTGSDVVSLSSNTITLRPGTYYVEFSAPAYNSNQHRCWLQNTTAGTVAVLGTSEFAPSTTVPQTRTFGAGLVTIAGSNANFQLQHSIANAQATNGLGVPSNVTSQSEVYSIVEIWRLD